MMIPKNKPIRDPAYLKSFRDAACYACGAQDGTVVAAHIRHGLAGGIGMKPDDSLTLPLCGGCHALQGASEVKFWGLIYRKATYAEGIDLAKEAARRRYRRWEKREKMNDWKGKTV